jgi:hypothetical protein
MAWAQARAKAKGAGTQRVREWSVKLWPLALRGHDLLLLFLTRSECLGEAFIQRVL